MALPILTFDERALSPRFGYVFRRRWLQPYESVVSMLWKFARMNGLPGHAVDAQLSPQGVNPYECGRQCERAEFWPVSKC